MEENQICCCGSSGWTKVIGWFQIVGSVMLIIALSFMWLFSSALWPIADNAKKPDGTPLIPVEVKKFLKTVPNAEIIGVTITLVLAVLSFFMAIILLHGSYKRNTSQIRAWLIYTAISLVIWTICISAPILVEPTGAVILFTAIVLAFGFAVQGFCLGVVGTHKKEIEASAGSISPVKA